MTKQSAKKTSDDEQKAHEKNETSGERHERKASDERNATMKNNGNNGNGHASANAKKTEEHASSENTPARRRGRQPSHSRHEISEESQARGLNEAENRYNRGYSEEGKYTTYNQDRDNYGMNDRRRSMRRESDTRYGYGSESGRHEDRQSHSVRYYPSYAQRSEPSHYRGNRQNWEDNRDSRPDAQRRYDDRGMEEGRQYVSSTIYQPRSGANEYHPLERERNYRSAPQRSIQGDWYGNNRPDMRESRGEPSSYSSGYEEEDDYKRRRNQGKRW